MTINECKRLCNAVNSYYTRDNEYAKKYIMEVLQFEVNEGDDGQKMQQQDNNNTGGADVGSDNDISNNVFNVNQGLGGTGIYSKYTNKYLGVVTDYALSVGGLACVWVGDTPYTLGEVLTKKELIESGIKPMFYTEDFTDGTFPKKSCINCNKAPMNSDMCTTTKCHKGLDGRAENWQGTLKGRAIYQNEESWIVGYDKEGIPVIKYGCFVKGSKVNTKHFSNETNAKTYYNELKWKGKLKFKIGDTVRLKVNTWYKSVNGSLIYITSTEHFTGYGWGTDGTWIAKATTTIKGRPEDWSIASTKEVEAALNKEVSARYSKGDRFNSAYSGSVYSAYSGIVEDIRIHGIDRDYTSQIKQGISTGNQWLYVDGSWASVVEKSVVNKIWGNY